MTTLLICGLVNGAANDFSAAVAAIKQVFVFFSITTLTYDYDPNFYHQSLDQPSNSNKL